MPLNLAQFHAHLGGDALKPVYLLAERGHQRVPRRRRGRSIGLRPADVGSLGVGHLGARQRAEFVVHPVAHVPDQLPDGVGRPGQAAAGEFRRQFEHAGHGVRMGAAAAEQVPEYSVGHGGLAGTAVR